MLKQFARAVAVLVVALGLVGCASGPFQKYVPDQTPQVNPAMGAILAAKAVTDIPVQIGRINHFDASSLGKLGKLNNEDTFMDVLPRTTTPSAQAVTATGSFINAFVREMSQKGFKFRPASETCNECMRVDFDLAYHEMEIWRVLVVVPFKQEQNVFFARSKIFYKGTVITDTKGDKGLRHSKGLLEKDSSREARVSEALARREVGRILDAWNVRVADTSTARQ